MGVVAENEITCTITIKDGDGTISNASFSIQKDPTGTSDLGQIVSKATNYKPFILGISEIGDGYSYKNGDYRGISSVGSGIGTELTLTFDNPVDTFTIYFDDNIQTYPKDIEINGTQYYSNNYVFLYSQATKQTSFTLKIISMTNSVVSGYSEFTSTSDYVGYYVVYNSNYTLVTNSNKNSLNITAGTTIAYNNYVNYPVYIVGVEDKIELKFNKRTGLKTCNLPLRKTSSIDEISFGLYSQTGLITVYDYNHAISNLVDLGVLNDNHFVDITLGKEQKSSIGKYCVNKWVDDGNDIYSIQLSDNLILLQSTIINDKNRYEQKTVSELFDLIISYSNGLITNISSTDFTYNYYISRYYVRYIYLNNKTVWECLDDLCKSLFLNGYIIGTTLYLFYQNTRDYIYDSENKNIVIPKNIIDGMPSVVKIPSNQYSKVNISTNHISKIFNQANNFNVLNVGPFNYYDYLQENNQTTYIADDHTLYHIAYADYDIMEMSNLWKLIWENPYGRVTFNKGGDDESSYPAELFEFSNDNELHSFINEYHPYAVVGLKCEVDSGGYYIEDFTKAKICIISSRSPTTPSGVIDVPTDDTITITVGGGYVEYETLNITTKTISYGSGNNIYNVSSNDFSRDYIDRALTAGYDIITKGLSNKQTIKFSIATTNLLDKSGDLRYDKDKGEILDFKNIQIQNFDGENQYRNLEWNVYARTFIYDGAFFIDVEGIGYRLEVL